MGAGAFVSLAAVWGKFYAVPYVIGDLVSGFPEWDRVVGLVLDQGFGLDLDVRNACVCTTVLSLSSQRFRWFHALCVLHVASYNAAS